MREGGRTAAVHALVATAVNADGYREVLGVDVVASEDGAGWLAFLRSLGRVSLTWPHRVGLTWPHPSASHMIV